MTKSTTKPKILGVIITVFVVGILLGGNIPTGSAEGEVPSWFKGVAGFWAEGGISTEEFLNGIQFLIAEKIIQVPGFVSAEEIGGSSEDLTKVWDTIGTLQASVDEIKAQEDQPVQDESMQDGLEKLSTTINDLQKEVDGLKSDDSGVKFYIKEKAPENMPLGTLQEYGMFEECDVGDILVGSFFQIYGEHELNDRFVNSALGNQRFAMDGKHWAGAYSLKIVCADVNEENELRPDFKQVSSMNLMDSELQKILNDRWTLFSPMYSGWDELIEKVQALEDKVFPEEDIPFKYIPLP